MTTARPDGASTSAKTGGCIGGPCPRRSPPQRSSRPSSSDRWRTMDAVVDAPPADAAIEGERLVVSVEDEFLRLPEIHSNERHPAVRQPHMGRFHHQRQSLRRDPLVAPVELVGFARRKAHRHIHFGRRSRALVTPCPGKAMDAVVGTLVAAAAQLLEKPLRRTPLPLGKRRLGLQQPGQVIHPGSQLRRRLDVAFIFELGLIATDNLAHRRPRNPKLPGNRLDALPPVVKSPPYLSYRIHTNHSPLSPSNRPATAKRKGLCQSSTRVRIGRENPRRGGRYCRQFYTTRWHRVRGS